MWVLLRPTIKGKWKCCEMGRTVFRSYPILGDPKAVSPVGGKGATKVLKQKPLGTDPHLTISKRSSECWLLIGHNYCPRSANSIAWVCLSVPECVRTRLLLSRHSVLYLSGSFKVVCARETFIFYFTNQKRNYRWLGKTFGRTIRICTSFLFPTPPRPLFAYPSLSRLPHSFPSSPLSESLEQAKELQVLVRSVRSRYACNFQDMWK